MIDLIAEHADPPSCSNPCPPDNACDECLEYWARLRREGYWTPERGWTVEGVKKFMEDYR